MENEVLVSRIAREVARDLSPVDMIRIKFGLDEDEYSRLINSSIFKTRLEEELAVWNASDAMSIAERIKAKTGTMIEESLPEVFEWLHDKNQPIVGKVRALEWASRVSGIGETERLGLAPGVTGGGSGINFNIFIGGEKQSFTQPADQPRIIEGEVVLNDKSA